MNNQFMKHRNSYNAMSVSDVNLIDYENMLKYKDHQKQRSFNYTNFKEQAGRDNRMYSINEGLNLDTISAVEQDGDSQKILRVKESDIILKPLKFMDILPARTKIAKLYDKEYNL